ncbi:MAG: aldo/keto reductase, partial [Pseudolysinimonas sp.]
DAGVAIIARVPLASGLLTGRYTHETAFGQNDHRSYNRNGEAFDRGETFSGVDFDEGVEAAREFSALAAGVGLEPATAALAWVCQLSGVTTVIPGARNAQQAVANAAAAAVPDLGPEFTAAVRDLYDRRLRASVHPHW